MTSQVENLRWERENWSSHRTGVPKHLGRGTLANHIVSKRDNEMNYSDAVF